MIGNVWRYSRLLLATTIAIVAGLVVSSLLVDLGPLVRARAEAGGSQAIERPLHIGRLSIRLLSGRFVIDDIAIEGLTASDRPFFTAERIEISVRWWNLLRGEFLIDTVDLVDWRMVVETFPGNRHNFPRLTRRTPAGDRPPRFVTTVAYLRARRGEFTYEDHGAPWSTVARNLDLTITKAIDYRGQALFSEGTVQIQNYRPMRADLRTSFKIEDGQILLDRIDLKTDGAVSVLTGVVDLRHWPEQTYKVTSRVEFPRMREIFFAQERFSLTGDGTFDGTFHIYHGGRELRGTFASALAGLNAYRFDQLQGSLVWLPDRFEVWDATSGFYGGSAAFTYHMAPLGGPAMARFEAEYREVDLVRLGDELGVDGIRLGGWAAGRHVMDWPLGRFRERRGEGRVDIHPSSGVHLMGPTAQELTTDEASVASAVTPLGGVVVYTFGPDAIELSPSYLATTGTYLQFQGRSAYGDRSQIPFHVASADWGESDRVLAGVLTALGSPTRSVTLRGSGTFDGIMRGAFRNPRIEGRFSGVAMEAWDVAWGNATARLVIENGYAQVSEGLVRRAGSEAQIGGAFSLGYPRRDGGAEIDARLQVTSWPVADLRDAFDLEAYPIDGNASGDLHLEGRYHAPFGFGRITILDGRAYGEPFEGASMGLQFEGKGIRLDGIRVEKAGGLITGAAYVGWDGTYSFNADGRRMPIEAITTAATPRLPLSGLLQFTASGAGSFEVPRFEVRGQIADLFVFDEGVGQVTGRVVVRGDVLTLEVEAASPRLAVSGSGRIALTAARDAELAFRFTNTSLDPYIRAFQPRLSPFTTAIASGAFHIVGELGDIDRLLVDGTIEQAELRLFDYVARNDGPIRLAFDRNTVRVDRLRLGGQGTALALSGEIRLKEDRIALKATGDTNLGILQGFFRDVRSAGAAELVASIQGPLNAPQLSGYASVSDGRLRYFPLPHSLDNINGRVVFDSGGIHLDGVTATLGGGSVRFSGRIGLKGYAPGEFDVSARGTAMQLRYPEGFRSVVDAELALEGDVATPRLTGLVTVRDAVWVKRFETGTSLLDLTGGGGEKLPSSAAPDVTRLPLQFDLRIVAPSTLRIENPDARIVSSAELTLRGTYDRPVLFGQAEIERGEVFFEGNRYVVTRGTVDFTNPTRIEPFFDVEAETRVRAPGQIYRVVFHAAGTAERFVPELSSDPSLPTVDILALLFGDVRDPRSAELRTLRAPEEAEQQLLQARAARLLASPIASEVGRVVQETFSVDTFQITPSLGDVTSQQAARLNPTARLLIGKRISERLFLTFSRAISAANRDQIILLEYNQSDRLSWVVSQNEDRTYALDFRVRHVF